MLQRALGRAFLPLCGAILLAAGAAAQTVDADQKPHLTFSFDPATGKGPTITYLSGNPSAAEKILSLNHEADKFRPVVRELDARAIAGSYSVEHSQANLFTFYLGFLLGHAIFL